MKSSLRPSLKHKITRTRLLIAAGFILLYGMPFVFTLWHTMPQRFVALLRSNSGDVNVLDYGARGDGVTDDGPAFAAAFADATRQNATVVIPKRTYVVNRTLKMTTGLVLRAEGATITHRVDNLPILSAMDVDDWTLQGPLTLAGTRTAADEPGQEAGLFISNCNRFIVDKLTVKDFKGYGIHIVQGAGQPKRRGDQGQFAFVSFVNNGVGLHLGEAGTAEYNLFTLLSFNGNDTAAEIIGGNNVVTAANVVDNRIGIHLLPGFNSGHGIIAASNINHNKLFNVQAESVDQGYTLSGCHIYGDPPTGGIIRLVDSQGIHFTGGTINAGIVVEGGGLNLAFDNYFPPPRFPITDTSALGFKSLFNFDESTMFDVRTAPRNSSFPAGLTATPAIECSRTALRDRFLRVKGR
ncbi:MAG: glycoside hydrolase family 55 protein [Pirellulales bacterium]|nr:glycoside hydrolase family 55 protein [Pirellulales bacterium]